MNVNATGIMRSALQEEIVAVVLRRGAPCIALRMQKDSKVQANKAKTANSIPFA